MNEFNQLKVQEVYTDNEKCTIKLKLEKNINLILTGNWFYTEVKPNDYVYFKSNSFEKNTYTIDNQDGFFILNPNHLITCTDLSNSSFCMRKTWLNERYRVWWGKGNKAFLIGNIVHELFQTCCKKNLITFDKCENELKQLLEDKNILKELILIDLDEKQLFKETSEYINSIIEFNKKYNSGIYSKFDNNYPKKNLCINNIDGIETNIFVPSLGLKGKIDLLLSVNVKENENKYKLSKVPLELKTGKVSYSHEHQGQVSLYMIMINTLKIMCDFGLVLYLKDGVFIKYVGSNEYIKKSLLQKRNELVNYLRYLDNGPETKNNSKLCSKCEHLFDCCLNSAAHEIDKYDILKKEVPELIEITLSHLNENYIEFFMKWTKMIFIEENDNKTLKNYQNCFWNFTSIERELADLGLAKLIIEDFNENTNEYVFKRDPKFNTILSNSFTKNQLFKTTESIILSIENDDNSLDKIGFVNGTIQNIDTYKINIILEKSIEKHLLSKTFRIDHYPFSSNNSILYSTILRLMTDENKNNNLRKLIIDKEKPTFELKLNSNLISIAKPILKSLNINQQKAILRVLLTNQYLLIKGNPGSGKTETIVALIKLLVTINKSVFIASHTNTAVDNILLKLTPNIKFMRIGNHSKINPNLKNYSECNLTRKFSSKDDLRNFYRSFNVFAGTCYSAFSHFLFEIRKFDYCIIDEASQILLPETLIPLFNCEKFILVGDPIQLPPIVRSKNAKKLGFDVSLFNYLLNEENCVELNIQYRMNKEIMFLANKCTYNEKLVCGLKSIEEATINLNNTYMFDCCNQVQDNKCINYIHKCLSGKLQDSVLFLNTEENNQTINENKNGEIYNDFEALIVTRIVDNLLKKHFTSKEIGIISPYQKQVKILKDLIKEYDIEINTIDQYQGRDKDIIIITCVKNSRSLIVDANEILSDPKRINVAITRAKKKLIIIGNYKTLSAYKSFNKILNCLRDDQKIMVKI